MTGSRVGVVGLGRMGSAIAARLLDEGVDTWVNNRTPQKAADLLKRGATWTRTPGDLARSVDLAITMVADDLALQQVIYGRDGVLSGAHVGLTVMDMSTVSPSASGSVAAYCEEAAVQYLRAPLSGSTALVAARSVSVLVSGPEDSFRAWRHILEALGSNVFYLGGADEARVMKIALNMVVGTTMLAMGEALVLGERAGLPWQSMLDVFCNSAVTSPLVKYKSELLARRDFTPAFTTSMLVKDLDLALDAAKLTGVVVPITALTRQLFQATVGLGWGDEDFASVVQMLEHISEPSRPAE